MEDESVAINIEKDYEEKQQMEKDYEEKQLMEKELVHWFKMKLGTVRQRISSWSICKVPSNLRTVNDEAYNPLIISIGPLHHGKDHLKAMEEHKFQYAQSLFLRTQDTVNPLETADVCARDVLKLVDNVLLYYKEPLFTQYKDKNELAKILLVDGSFMVELFLRYSSNNPHQEFQNDPIFSTSWMLQTLQRDLALLENQIPWLVLDVLFNLTVKRAGTILSSHLILHELALHFFETAIHVNEETIRTASRKSSSHLLHLIHNCYAPMSSRVARVSKGPFDHMQNANMLSKSGVRFKQESSKHLLNLRFAKGVFKIPQLIIHDVTDSLFRNLIAFEQCCRTDAQYVASYVLLMDRLVDTPADVELLESKGIIKNHLGGCDDVSQFLNNICKQVVLELEDFYFAGLCEKVNKFFNKRWHRHCASLRRDYFRNPWTIISFVAAFFLLSITTLQTVYSVLSYYPH